VVLQIVGFDPVIVVATRLIEQSLLGSFISSCLLVLCFVPPWTVLELTGVLRRTTTVEEKVGSVLVFFCDLEIGRLVFELFEVPYVVDVELVSTGAKPWSSFYWVAERNGRRTHWHVRLGWCVAELFLLSRKRRHCNAVLRYVTPNMLLSFVEATQWCA
jgi:hypothetical protein